MSFALEKKMPTPMRASGAQTEIKKSSGEAMPSEEVTLDYEEIDSEYEEIEDDSESGDSSGESSWDVNETGE